MVLTLISPTSLPESLPWHFLLQEYKSFIETRLTRLPNCFRPTIKTNIWPLISVGGKLMKKCCKMWWVFNGKIIRFRLSQNYLWSVRLLLDTWLKTLKGLRFFIAIMAKEELAPLFVAFSCIWVFSKKAKRLWSSMGKEGLKGKIMESHSLARSLTSDISKDVAKNRTIFLRFYQ